jgi:alkanesulfonate monooxygenase SsuD/methylene tetrahydromethanopterin reductase-like flavin-dependent oxidoreductase (luciferase family)
VIGDRDVVFGVFMPQGWKMELSGVDGAEAKWSTAVDIVLRAEELGYDSIWLYDHFHNVPRPAHEAVFECWTTIAAISQLTSRIRLGQMVGCNSYRNPALLAKITSTVDVISGGRLDWGIGAGWYENEYRAYGYDFPKPKDRIGMLRECVEIVRSMWTEPETTYKGKHYSVLRAHCDPNRSNRRTRRSGSGVGESSSRCASWPDTRIARTSEGRPTSGHTSATFCASTARQSDATPTPSA